VGAVDQQLGVVPAAGVRQCGDVTGGAVVRRVQHPQGGSTAVGEGALDHRCVQTVRDAESLVPPWFQPDRTGADLHQAGEHRLVGVACHQHWFVGA
jgi:hypothetical protein